MYISQFDAGEASKKEIAKLRMLSLSLFNQGSLCMMRLLFSIAKNVISDSFSKNYSNLLISTSHGHPIIKTKEIGYLMCFLDALGTRLGDSHQQDNHQHGQP